MRRLSGALAAALLVPALLAGCSDDDGDGDGDGDGGPDRTTPASPSTPATPQPAVEAAGWLTGQLEGGLVHNDEFDLDDIGLTLDVALALDEADAPGAEATVEEIATAVDVPAVLGGYVGAPRTGLFAGATAKAVLLAEAADRDPRDLAGTDLVAQLESTVSTASASSGRVADTGAEDYTTVIGQAYAVWALDEVDSGSADEAASYLLTQQCADGWFRAPMPSPDTADQACDADPASAADVDTTALAVLALADRAEDDAEAGAAVDLAVQWLVDSQEDDGSFLGETIGGATEGLANANSTGLASWALGELGETDAAADAAGWLVEHQVPADATGPLADQAGAVAYDDAALAAGEQDGIEPETLDQWRRSTAQALPGLAHGTP